MAEQAEPFFIHIRYGKRQIFNKCTTMPSLKALLEITENYFGSKDWELYVEHDGYETLIYNDATLAALVEANVLTRPTMVFYVREQPNMKAKVEASWKLPEGVRWPPQEAPRAIQPEIHYWGVMQRPEQSQQVHAWSVPKILK
jgi:hypothetical protein